MIQTPNMILFLNYLFTFEVCDHNVVITWFIRAAVVEPGGGRGLLKTAVFVPFFLTRKAFIWTWNRCIFLHPNQTGDFSDVHCSFASAPGASQISAEKVH